jgi:uncharacterized membrane protein
VDDSAVGSTPAGKSLKNGSSSDALAFTSLPNYDSYGSCQSRCSYNECEILSTHTSHKLSIETQSCDGVPYQRVVVIAIDDLIEL